MDALKSHDHNLLCNLLTDESFKVEINKGYQEEKYKTLLHLAVDNEDLVIITRVKSNEISYISMSKLN